MSHNDRSTASLRYLVLRCVPFLAAAISVASGGAVVPVSVSEVVLRRLIAQTHSSDLVLCLQMDSADPPKALLLKLQRPDRTVVPASQCRWWDGTHPNNYQFGTGRPAHFLTVSSPVWASKSDVSVQAADAFHGKWVMYWTVRLVRSRSGWEIVSFHLDAEA